MRILLKKSKVASLQLFGSLLARVGVSGVGFALSVFLVYVTNKSVVGEYFLLISFANLLANVFIFGMGPKINTFFGSRIHYKFSGV